jgi:hypothetical protein
MVAEPPKRWLLDAITVFFVLAGVLLAVNALSMGWQLLGGGGPGDFLSIVGDPPTLRDALFHFAVGAVFAWTPITMRANIKRRFAAAAALTDSNRDAKP